MIGMMSSQKSDDDAKHSRRYKVNISTVDLGAIPWVKSINFGRKTSSTTQLSDPTQVSAFSITTLLRK